MITELQDLIARLMKTGDANYIAMSNAVAYFAHTEDKDFLQGLDTKVQEIVFDEIAHKRSKAYAEKLTGIKSKKS